MAERNLPKTERPGSIIDLDEIPSSPHEDVEPCDVYIVADDMLASPDGEKIVRLRPDALALNGLLKTRDRWASGPEVRDAANLLIGSSGFAHRLRLLQNDLRHVAAIEEPVEARGVAKAKAYRLSPQFRFYDKRSEDSLSLKRLGIMGECVPFDQYDETNEDHRLRFDSSDSRRNFLATLFKQYATLPEAQRSYQGLFSLGHNQREALPELPPEEVLAQLLVIERGAVAFAQTTQTEDTKKAGIDAVIAYHSLLLTSIPMLRSLAHIYGRRAYGRLNDELFQQGCETVAKIIMDAGKGDIRKFSDYFYKKGASDAAYAMMNFVRIEWQGAEQISERDFEVWRATQGVYGTLAQKLQREPSPAEIAAEIEIDGFSRERIEEAVCKVLSSSVSISMDAFEDYGENLLTKYRYYEDEIDRQIEVSHFKDLIDMVFESSELDDREKITLSLFHDVYRSDLASAVFKNRKQREPFEYPLDKEAFEAIIHKIGGRVTELSEVVKFDKERVRGMLRGAYEKARTVLQDEI